MHYATPMQRRNPAHAYADLGLETQVLSASPARLISLLFAGARKALAQARLHATNGQVAARGQAISKAIAIVENGLKASLDMQAGGSVATSLHQAYDLIVAKLLRANLKNDLTQLDAADGILADLAAAWRSAADPVVAAQTNATPLGAPR